MQKKLTIFLLAICLAGLSCNQKEYRTFSTNYLSVGIDNKGYIRSMKNTTVHPHREFSPVDKPSPLLSLYDSNKRIFYYPENAVYHSSAKKLTLTFTNGSVAEVKILPQDKYMKLTLASLEPRNGVDAIQWGSYHTNINNLFGEIIGVARDTSESINYSIGVLALDDNTIGGTADLEGDAAPFQYVIHSPDPAVYPLPSHLREGQIFTLGGNGISDVAFYAHKEPYYRILYGNAATIDANGRISVQYLSRDRRKHRNVYYSLIPNMPANTPQYRVGRLGSIIDPMKDIVENSNTRMLWTNTGVALFNNQGGVGICPVESPLISLGEPGNQHFDRNYKPQKPYVYVNLYNNTWATNFREWWGGTLTSTVRLWSFDQYNGESSVFTPAMEARVPMLVARSSCKPGNLPVVQPGITLSRKGVAVTAFGKNPDGNGTILRFWEESGASGACEVKLPRGIKASTAQPVDLRGRKAGNALIIKNGTFVFDVKGFAPASFVLY